MFEGVRENHRLKIEGCNVLLDVSRLLRDACYKRKRVLCQITNCYLEMKHATKVDFITALVVLQGKVMSKTAVICNGWPVVPYQCP